jgi:hypothetical protein
LIWARLGKNSYQNIAEKMDERIDDLRGAFGRRPKMDPKTQSKISNSVVCPFSFSFIDKRSSRKFWIGELDASKQANSNQKLDENVHPKFGLNKIG